MRSHIFLALACCFLPLSNAQADNLFKSNKDNEKRVHISSILTNDFIGDGADRWRTSSYEVSATFGGGNLNLIPTKALERFQFRARAEILAPERLDRPAAGDRQYAGVLGFGLFTHFQKNNYDISYGGELVFVGESTGLGSLQQSFHDIIGVMEPSQTLLDNQIPNEIIPTAHISISKSIKSRNKLIRPFFEAQAGVESLARVGTDVIFGSAMVNDFLLRDTVSGQLISHSKSDQSIGFGFLVGADVAYVADSQLLPEENGFNVKELRSRARVGVVYQSDTFDTFYGLTWLGEEFEAQRESQFVGSINFGLNF